MSSVADTDTWTKCDRKDEEKELKKNKEGIKKKGVNKIFVFQSNGKVQ